MNLNIKINSRKEKNQHQPLNFKPLSKQDNIQSKLQSSIFSENQRDSDDSISSKKQIIFDGMDSQGGFIKRLTLENQNLTYQIAFKDIAIKKREEMIGFISKDQRIAKEQMRQLEICQLVKNNSDAHENSKSKLMISTDRGSTFNNKMTKNSLPKLQQIQPNSTKASASSHYNTLMNTKDTTVKKQITFQDFQKSDLIFPIRESLANVEEDNQLKRINKKKANTLILNINNTLQESQPDLLRPISQFDMSALESVQGDRKRSFLRSNTRNCSPLKRLSSPIKSSNKNKYIFDFENSIYKSLEQLKASKLSQEKRFLEEQVRSVDDFAEDIARESLQVRKKLAEDIKHLLRDYIKVLDQSIVLKKLAISNSKIHRCYRAQEVINAITEEVMGNIECEHVVFYIKDQYSQVLWTTDKNKPNQMISVEPKKGILMHTLNSEKALRVEEVESDPRYSKEYDGCQFKNIKNMICIPLKDKQNIIRGLLQIINFKNSEFQVSVDEILRLLTENISSQILSVLEFEQAVNNNHRVMKLMEVSKQINYLQDENEIIKMSKELLTQVFLTPLAVVYLIKDGQIITNSQEKYPLNSGVIGEALIQEKIIEMVEHYSHPNANFNIDIETVLPTVSVPVMTKNKQLIAVFQIVQDAYIRSNSIPREQIFYFESLQFFADLLAFNIERSQTKQNIQ